MSKFLRIIIGVVIIILLIFISMFLLGGNIEGEAILFVLFMLISTVIGCSVGVLIVKTNEKKTGKKLAYNTSVFYIGVPCCIFWFIAISLFMVLIN